MEPKHPAEHPKKRSRTVWFVLGAVVVLAAVFGAYSWLTSSPTRTAFLNVEEGQVDVDQGQGWHSATDNMDLSLNDKVRTLQGKATVVLFESILVTLDDNTEVSIASLAKEKAAIKQEKGSTWNKFMGLSGVQGFEVATPNTVATVRGTAFGVDTGKEDEVLVGEGDVGVASEGDQISVGAFEKVAKKKGAKFAKKEWSAEDKARVKKRIQRHIHHLKKLRWAELGKKQLVVNKLKAKYGVSDADIQKFFDDVDAGKREDQVVLDKVPVKSESLVKIKRLDDQVKKELRFLKSLGD